MLLLAMLLVVALLLVVLLSSDGGWRCFALMVSGDAKDTAVQITRDLYNDGGRRHDGCHIVDRLRVLKRWHAEDFFFFLLDTTLSHVIFKSLQGFIRPY
jgi:hypothetical protein